MNQSSFLSLPVQRWLIGRSLLLALICLLTLDAVLCATSAYALQLGPLPSSLTFSGPAGGTNPASQSFAITNSGGGTLSWTLRGNVSWLGLSAISGSTTTETDTIIVSVATSGLAAGTYSGSITVGATGTAITTIPLTLIVTSSATGWPGTIGVAPANLAFTGTVGGPNPVAKTFAITNTGRRTLSWTLSDDQTWLTLNTVSGSTRNETDTITANVSTVGMTAGTYAGLITLTASGSTRQVPVTLTLTGGAPATPAIGLNTTSLGFFGTVGGANPSAQNIGISNAGGGTLTWSAGDNATWLTLSPFSGTNSGTVIATVNLAGLLSGSYTATVTVTATGASPRTIPVTLSVTGSTTGGPGTIGVAPVNLAFTGTVGGANPAAKTFAITNTGGGTLSWTLTDNKTWLTLNAASGSTTTETDTITANVSIAGMAAGTYPGLITVTTTGSTTSTRQIPVSVTVSATTASSVALSWNPNTETDLAGYNIYQGTSSGNYATPVATITSPTTSYTATGLQTGTTYFFAIKAYDIAGNESLFSNEVSKSIY